MPAAQAPADDRVLVDNSNLSELKLTADEAIERILSRPAPLPAAAASSTTTAVAAAGAGKAGGHAGAAAKWTVSHFHTDLRLVLGYAAALLMIAVGVWSYFIEKDWEVNKGPTAIAVAVYLVLSAIQTVDAYVQGNRIFYGSRKNPTTGKPEQLVLTSPPLARHKVVPAAAAGQRGSSIPPEYVLEVEYTPAGAASGQTKKGKIVLGNFSEWITEEGEFVESIFEERLRSNLATILGE